MEGFQGTISHIKQRPGLDQPEYRSCKLEAEEAVNVRGMCEEWTDKTHFLCISSFQGTLSHLFVNIPACIGGTISQELICMNSLSPHSHNQQENLHKR